MDFADVLIVGAGPTGLLMAIELHRHGLTCRLIEKSPSPSDKSRALALQARTLEIFSHLGLSDEFLRQGIKITKGNIISKDKMIAQINFQPLASDFPFVLGLEQNKTEKILSDHVESLGIKIERYVELTSFELHENYVKSTLQHHKTNQKETIQTSWLVGCDGAHSFVRKSLGLSYKGKLFKDVFSLADVKLQWKYPHDELFTFLNAEGIVAAIPLPAKDCYRLIFQLKRCRDVLDQMSRHGIISSEAIPNPSFEETEKILHQYCDKNAKIVETSWMANFHINSRLTNHYRKKRVFLAGDAAHIHSPVGGQGMNTGFSDVFNLAWKLSLVHQGKAKDALLDTYEKERHHVGEILLNATERASFIATLHNPILIGIRNLLMSHFVKKPLIKKKLIESLSQVGISYPQSQIAHEDGSFPHHALKVGMRAPNAHIIYQDQAMTLFDLWERSNTFQLLIFSNSNPLGKEIDLHFLETLFSHRKALIETYLITRDSSLVKELPHKKILIDQDGSFYKSYAVNKTCLYLIRPDLYIGYRQSPINLSQFSSYLAKIFFN